MKAVSKIVKLNNYNEVKYLLSEGVKYGDDGISRTHSKHSGTTYLLCEAPKNLKFLENYRKSLITR